MKPVEETILGPDTEIYLSQYLPHAKDAQALAQGLDDDELQPSFVSPTDYWTATEKNIFFHSLGLYSRLRPDLISASLKSKSVADVCAYITLLEQAAANQPPVSRQDLDIAMRVTDPWVDFEEINARILVSKEPEWDDYNTEKRFLDETQQETARLAAEYPGENAASMREHHLDVWKRDKESERLREDVLKSLDLASLTKLDSLIRSPSPEGDDCATPEPEGFSPTPDQLSPKSRRLLQKRLYMRRIRAEKRGTTMIDDPTKLASGKKRKLDNFEGKGRKGAAETSNAADSHSEDSPPNKKRKKRGKTRLEKARDLFAERGVDTETLTTTDLGLFNLARLGRLTKLFGTVYHTPERPSAISANAVRSLNAIVLHFTTQAVHHAIIHRETERLSKSTRKVWKISQDKEILPLNVRAALEIMGVANLTKKGFFEAMEGDDEPEQSPEPPVEGDDSQRTSRPNTPVEDDSGSGLQEDDLGDDTGSDDHDVLEEDIGLYYLHCEMYPPLIALPPYRVPGFQYSRSDDQPLALEEDEEVLRRNMIEEDEIDRNDEVKEKQNERELWKQVS